MKDTNSKTYDVFISYSHDDHIVAEGICGYLESNKIRCFIDYRNIPKGNDWARVIPDAIHDSRLMLVVFSGSFNISEETDRELSIAANIKNPNIPILVFRVTDDDFKGMKEYYLLKSNWLDAFPEPEKCFGRLLENVCLLLGIRHDAVSSANDERPVHHGVSESDTLVKKALALQYSEHPDSEMVTYYFRKAAKMGNADGEYRLGWSYYNGYGIPNDWDMARHWFEKAVEHGNARAMERLACMYRYGVGVKKDILKAMSLYTQSADNGDGFAMKQLGETFHTGELGVQDEQRSKEYYAQAIEVLYDMAMGENDPEAQHVLADCYFDGEGVKQNYAQALSMYKRSMANHYASAYNNLGLCYSQGIGVVADEKKAFELMLQSAEMGNCCAMSNVSSHYHKGTGVAKDEKKADYWLRKSAECGYCSAQCSIANSYTIGYNCEKNITKAVTWYERAIESGSFDALYFMGYLYECGEIECDGGAKKMALDYYKRAAMAGHVDSFIKLANCYYDGIGTEKNMQEAARWYGKLADVYTSMVEREENFYRCPSGNGFISHTNFTDDVASFFGDAFLNLAALYREGNGVEKNVELAHKWERTGRQLKGEKKEVETMDEKQRLERKVSKGDVCALEDLLLLCKKEYDEDELTRWATYAVSQRMLVKKRNLLAGEDSVALVLKYAKASQSQYLQYLTDMLNAAMNNGDYDNCYSLYNALCKEHERGHLPLDAAELDFIRKDALEVMKDYRFIGYLRPRSAHFSLLFPDYRPSRVASGCFDNERDFMLFYASHTRNLEDNCVTDAGQFDIFAPMKKDKSYKEVVASQNGRIVKVGNLYTAYCDFCNAYRHLLLWNKGITSVEIPKLSFENLVPHASPEQLQRCHLQMMKALISVRTLFGSHWNNVLNNLADDEKLLDIAELDIVDDEDLQMLLVGYVEFTFEYEGFLIFSSKLMICYFDKDKKLAVEEKNAYVTRLEDAGIKHKLPKFTEADLPESYFEQ